MQKKKILLNFYLNKLFNNLKIKKNYKKTLNNKTIYLNEIKNFIQINSFKKFYLVNYIIYIIFSESNTFLVLTDCFYNIKFFFSKGILKNEDNLKNNRYLIIKKFYNVLISKFKFLKFEPTALHFKNVTNSQHDYIIRMFKKKKFIKIIKFFDSYPYNGCRKKKLKRKRFRKKKRNG